MIVALSSLTFVSTVDNTIIAHGQDDAQRLALAHHGMLDQAKYTSWTPVLEIAYKEVSL